MNELKPLVDTINELARRLRRLENADRPYNVDGRFTTDEADIDTLQSNMTTAQGDIITLDGRVDTIETHGLFHPLTTALTSTSWDGDAKTVADNGTIDLSVVFGVPANIKGVLVRLEHTDDTVGAYCCLGPSVLNYDCAVTVTQVTNKWVTVTCPVPCDANGDVYFTCSENITLVKIQIWGYWI